MNESGTTIVVVEQNATLALAPPSTRTCSRRAASCSAAVAADLQANESVRRSYLGY